MAWKNRVKGLQQIRAGDLIPHPQNWRTHPTAQQNALHAVLEEVGRLDERYFITGLPVAEDRFGVEMFKQMGISAPLAALVIFVLMLVFFRSLSLVTAPMVVALATIAVTMGDPAGIGPDISPGIRYKGAMPGFGNQIHDFVRNLQPTLASKKITKDP